MPSRSAWPPCWTRLLRPLCWHAVGKVAAVWVVPGVHAPHDMVVTASPVRLAGKERPLALLVAETREAGNSQLHKFILLPEGGLALGPAAFASSMHQEGASRDCSASHARHGQLCPIPLQVASGAALNALLCSSGKLPMGHLRMRRAQQFLRRRRAASPSAVEGSGTYRQVNAH